MSVARLAEQIRAGELSPREAVESYLERIPVGRYGHPEEIAALVAWLLLEAPAFLTGAVLPIDGGMTVP